MRELLFENSQKKLSSSFRWVIFLLAIMVYLGWAYRYQLGIIMSNAPLISTLICLIMLGGVIYYFYMLYRVKCFYKINTLIEDASEEDNFKDPQLSIPFLNTEYIRYIQNIYSASNSSIASFVRQLNNKIDASKNILSATKETIFYIAIIVLFWKIISFFTLGNSLSQITSESFVIPIFSTLFICLIGFSVILILRFFYNGLIDSLKQDLHYAFTNHNMTPQKEDVTSSSSPSYWQDTSSMVTHSLIPPKVSEKPYFDFDMTMVKEKISDMHLLMKELKNKVYTASNSNNNISLEKIQESVAHIIDHKNSDFRKSLIEHQDNILLNLDKKLSDNVDHIKGHFQNQLEKIMTISVQEKKSKKVLELNKNKKPSIPKHIYKKTNAYDILARALSKHKENYLN